MTDPDLPCLHRQFRADVSVARNYVAEEVGPPDAYMAEIRVWCDDCNEPFRFTGVQAGLSPIRPASADPDFGLGLPGFAVTWREQQ